MHGCTDTGGCALTIFHDIVHDIRRVFRLTRVANVSSIRALHAHGGTPCADICRLKDQAIGQDVVSAPYRTNYFAKDVV